MPSKRVNITLQDALLSRVDQEAKEKSLSRSGVISVALSSYFTAQDSIPSLNKVLDSMASVMEQTLRGEISPSIASAKLDAIQETYSDVIAGKK